MSIWCLQTGTWRLQKGWLIKLIKFSASRYEKSRLLVFYLEVFMNIVLKQGNCLELMKDIPDKSIDMILCDLPYGTTKCDWDKMVPLKLLWEQYERVIKDNSAIVLFSQQPFTTDLIQSNRKLFRYEIIWKKTLPTGFLNAKKMPMRYHENICVFYKHLPTYNPQMRTVESNNIGRERVNGGKAEQYGEFRKEDWKWTETGKRYPSDLVEFDIPEDLEDVVVFSNWNGALFGNTDKTVKHPTSKPVALLEYLIKTYTNPSDTVLDNCMGSGSTGIACVNTGRNFIGMEILEPYFKLSDKRIRKAKTLKQEREMSDAAAKSVNRCHDFAFNPIDAFGENEKGYRPRSEKSTKKAQCDGQMSLFG